VRSEISWCAGGNELTARGHSISFNLNIFSESVNDAIIGADISNKGNVGLRVSNIFPFFKCMVGLEKINDSHNRDFDVLDGASNIYLTQWFKSFSVVCTVLLGF